MSENREFIAAKDLPITDAESVNVLCVDNGELKLKEGATFGGSGGGGGYVIVLSAEEMDTEESTDTNLLFEIAESYDNFMDILYNGGSVWFDVSFMGSLQRMLVDFYGIIEDGVMLAGSATIYGNQINIIVGCPNGTWTPPTA